MPKKTREEKMAAALRRLKQQVALQQSPRPAVASERPTPESTSAAPETTAAPNQSVTPQGYSLSNFKQKSPPSPQLIRTEGERYNYAYVTGDLRKIAVLASAAVALEIILSLTTRASFAKLILRTFGIEI